MDNDIIDCYLGTERNTLLSLLGDMEQKGFIEVSMNDVNNAVNLTTKGNKMTSNKELNKYIEEGINAMVEIQGAKELLSSVVESICDKFEYEKAEANQIIAKAYQKKYEEEKYTKTKERTEKVYEVVEGV